MHYAKHGEKRKNEKLILLLSALVLILTLAVGTTLAYLYAQTDPLVNTFEPIKVSCEVEEKFDGKIKKDVKIENTGDTAAYIRAAVVVTWVSSDGSVAAEAPVAGTDYQMTYAENTGWIEGSDGFRYYQKPVDPDAFTGILIQNCTQMQEKEGYTLSVEIVVSAIQSLPTEAVTRAWGVTVDSDGNMTGKEGGVISE